MEVLNQMERIVTIKLNKEETQWLNEAMDDFFRGQPSNNELDKRMSKAFCEATTPKLTKKKWND